MLLKHRQPSLATSWLQLIIRKAMHGREAAQKVWHGMYNLKKDLSCFLQLESHSKTASKGSKLSRLFSAKKSPRDKSTPSPSSSANQSPGSMAGPVSLDELLIYQSVSSSNSEAL